MVVLGNWCLSSASTNFQHVVSIKPQGGMTYETNRWNTVLWYIETLTFDVEIDQQTHINESCGKSITTLTTRPLKPLLKKLIRFINNCGRIIHIISTSQFGKPSYRPTRLSYTSMYSSQWIKMTILIATYVDYIAFGPNYQESRWPQCSRHVCDHSLKSQDCHNVRKQVFDHTPAQII